MRNDPTIYGKRALAFGPEEAALMVRRQQIAEPLELMIFCNVFEFVTADGAVDWEKLKESEYAQKFFAALIECETKQSCGLILQNP